MADLNYPVGKHLLDAMLGIDDYCLDVVASVLEITSGFFVYRLVFGSNLLPIQVLFYGGVAYDDNTTASAEESAIYSDYNGAYFWQTRLSFLIPVKVFLNGFLGFAVFIGKLFKSLFAKDIFLK